MRSRQAFQALALTILSIGFGSSSADPVPNIIVILADDLGYGDLSCYGQTNFVTPRLDRMAAEGMRFSQAYAGAPVCAPSRCVLLTGLHTGHARIRANVGDDREPVPLHAEDIAIAEVLHGAGYVTACIGKWGLGNQGSTGDPRAQGFDHFFGFMDQRDAHFHYPRELSHNGTGVALAGNDPDKQTGIPAQTLFTNQALGFVQKQSKAPSPFFLLLAYTYPHAELAAPADEIAAFVGRFGEEKPFAKDHYGAQPTPRAAFAAMMTMLDRDVGRILDELDRLGIAEDTLVIFTSDNGPAGLGGHDYPYFNSNGSLRAAKRSVYEGGIRVPFIARWPGRIAPAGDVATPVAAWDLLPTFAELARAQPPDKIDGVSLVPLLLGGAATPIVRDYLYWEFPGDGGQRAVRLGQWKGVRRNTRYAPDGPVELYNLDVDRAEMHNVAPEHPDIAARIADIMRSAHTPPSGG